MYLYFKCSLQWVWFETSGCYTINIEPPLGLLLDILPLLCRGDPAALDLQDRHLQKHQQIIHRWGRGEGWGGPTHSPASGPDDCEVGQSANSTPSSPLSWALQHCHRLVSSSYEQGAGADSPAFMPSGLALPHLCHQGQLCVAQVMRRGHFLECCSW